MASTDSPSSSLEFRGQVPTAHEPKQTAPQDANRPVAELTVVNVDPQKHPKNKRKRTQAGDKAALEAAYRENPKPDKIARLEIVKRVSLNEKEVQIWFQNRRQNDRRKSRPLTAQEIAALRSGGMQIISDPTLPASSVLADAPYPQAPGPVVHTPNRPAPAASHGFDSPRLREQACSTGGGSPGNGDSEKENKEGALESEQGIKLEPAVHPSGLSQSFPGTTGYLANRWNASTFSTPSMARDDSQRTDFFTPSSCSSTPSMTGPSPPSRVRLSFSFEGKAEIVSNEPSSPRLQPERPMSTTPTLPHVRPRILHRSHSALPSVTLPPISTLTGGLPPPRLLRGRSRDVNAWELCCDEDAPDDLTKMAENEANGSALAAISILRSFGSVLQPNSNKRNAPLSRNSQRNSLAKKPKLGKGHSNVSRYSLPDPEKKAAAVDENGAMVRVKDAPAKKMRVSMLVSPSGGDSDKENLSPDEDGNPQRLTSTAARRRTLPQTQTQPPRTDRPLQDQRAPALGPDRAIAAAALQRGMRGGSGSPLRIFEDGGEKPGPEVEKFMAGEVSPGKKGDADCVAGLLALSQGNWR